MQQEKIWVLRQKNVELKEQLCRTLNISPLLADLLSARTIANVEDAAFFLDPRLKNLLDPSSFIDMDKAVKRIVKAIQNKETIGLFGDYDVDGVCSTAILSQFFGMIGASFKSTLPNRMQEGYGLSLAGVNRLYQRGAKLIITADCGILAHDPIEYAVSLGLDVIVVDHHQVGETLPKAIAVVNPKRPDCRSEADYLCAAGLCFFLCLALRRALREENFFSSEEPDLKILLDLVALATVADVVPLLKNNRILVKAGLDTIKKGQRIGLKALLDAARVDQKKISSTNLGFHLGPRINAAGRLEDATVALDLLNHEDPVIAMKLASELDATNEERRNIEQDTVKEAIAIIESWPDHHELFALVLHNESWHPGVVGIVASRIAERFHRPAIIIGEKGKGSGRSISGIDLHDMVHCSSTSLAGFGGHAHAIGLTLGSEGVDVFREHLLATMQAKLKKEIFQKKISYDAELDLSLLNLNLVDELAKLEPFGAANPSPIMRINRCFMRNLRKLDGGHLKGELENKQGFASFIAFRTDIDDELATEALDVLAVVEKNEWQGRISPQLRIIDYKKSPN